MRMLKIVGICLLLIAMGYASNWDIPKETQADWEREHWEELKAYEEAKNAELPYVIINGDKYEGAYIDGMWYEPAELYQEVVDCYIEKGAENGE